MNRQEQIDNASYEYTGEYTNSDFHFGAEWADNNPKEGLWNKEKVCQYLLNNLWQVTNDLCTKEDFKRLINNLTKAMEE